MKLRLSHSAALAFAAIAFAALAIPARAETPAYANVLSAVTLDFTGDGAQDRAVLVLNDNSSADLYLYLVKDDAKGESALALAQSKAGIAFSGGMWGQLPSLESNGKGSLMIKSMNDSVGRDRWSQTLTIVYRNKEFLVAGISFTARDTLDPKAGGSCELNLLTGKGLRNGKPVQGKPAPIRLADWSDDKLPKECRF